MGDDAKKPPPSPGERMAAACERIADEAMLIRQVLERLSPPPPPVVNLDDAKGNPTIPFDPRTWKGPSFKGKRYSAAPAEYLIELAKAFESMGENASPRERHFKRLDAARARGWAERIKAGWKPRTLTPPPKPDPRTAPAPASKMQPPPPPKPMPTSTDYPADWDEPAPVDDDELEVK